MATITDRPAVRPDAEPHAGGDRFVGVALLGLAALFAGVQLLAGEVIPPLAVPAVIYLGLGVATLRRRPRWLLITIAVLLVVHLVSSIPFIAASLAHPETPATFLSDAFIMIVALAVLAGVIAALGGAGQGSRRPIILVAGLAAVAAVVLSLGAAAGVESDVAEPGDATVEALGARFPAEVQVPAAGALWVDNQDPFRHTLVVDGTDVHVELPGSTAVRVETTLAPGTYRYFCDVPGHERMEGELVVR